MDTSETYIKMCDCPEIQGLRNIRKSYQDGDVIVATQPYEQVEGDDWPCIDIKVGEANIIHNSWRMDDRRDYYAEKCIWLPRQDQLQEMVKGVESVYLALLPERVWTLQSSFNKFTHELYSHEHGDEWASMEQLWLAFVMKEKYGKVWDGEEWDIP